MFEDGKNFQVDCGDNLTWMQGLPTGCCSLAMTSPPYSAQRLYGAVKFTLEGEAWVDFMIPRVVEACRVVNGLVCINMSGPVKERMYRPVVEWLVSDLTRRHGLVCGPAPYVFFRYGIPGSGGSKKEERYHRRDWEPVYCFARPECLPLSWTDDTAMGHPPKWAPGGEMSNRTTTGARVNQWGKCGGHESGGTQNKDGKRQRKSRPSHVNVAADTETADLFGNPEEPSPHCPRGNGGRESMGRKPDGTPMKPTGKKMKGRATRGHKDGDTINGQYEPPVLANPGNVIRAQYDAEEVRKLFDDLVSRKIEPGDVIRCLVGGGLMGHPLCHENEAPFPESLAEFFVRSYAPPGSVVLDPFCGSGTTGAVSVRHGRRFLGADIRQKQVEIAIKRISGETADLFA